MPLRRIRRKNRDRNIRISRSRNSVTGGLAALAIACAPQPIPPSPTPSASQAQFTRIITPFTVTDETGQPYAIPFTGGFDVPRPQFIDIDSDGDLDLFV